MESTRWVREAMARWFLRRLSFGAIPAIAFAAGFLTASWNPIAAQAPLDCPRADAGAINLRSLVVASPEGAVCAVVQAGDSVYAGDCAATVSPRDIGKVCSKLIAQRGTLRAYLVGRTFSEFSAWIFVEQTRSGWTPRGTAPLDFAAPALVVPWPEYTVTSDPLP